MFPPPSPLPPYGPVAIKGEGNNVDIPPRCDSLFIGESRLFLRSVAMSAKPNIRTLINICLMAGMALMMILIIRTISSAAGIDHGHANNAPTGGFTVTSAKPFDALMKDAMALMHREMVSAKTTGDPDRDFCAMMIPHHEGAVNMAKIVLLYGKNKEIRSFAQKVITNQSNEIKFMEGLMKKHAEASSVSDGADIVLARRRAMASMMSAMEKSATTGDPDRDFVVLMIPHHGGAIEMSEAALPLTKNKQLQILVKEIIAEQRYEIQFMKSWLGRQSTKE